MSSSTATEDSDVFLHETDYRLALELAEFLDSEMCKYRDAFMRVMLHRDGKKKPTKKWLKKFYNKKKQKTLRSMFLWRGEYDEAVVSFWQTHPYDLARLNRDQRNDIEKKAHQVMRNKDAHSEAIDALLQGIPV